MKKEYDVFYDTATAWFRKKYIRVKIITAGNQILTWLFYIAYPSLLIWLLVRKNPFFLKALLIPAVTFIILSMIRKKVNRPRPYEQWHIDPLIHKNTKGKSMPSRHLFSSAVIAMVFLYMNRAVGITALLLSITDGFLRVVGGVHYPSDVIAGFLCGCFAGALLWF